MFARDIVRRAISGYYAEPWIEMLESVSIDVDEVSEDLGTTADLINQSRVRRVQQMLEEHSQSIAPVVETPKELTLDLVPDTKAGSKRKKLFGYALTYVIRWMGQSEWTFRQAKKALAVLDLPVADATIRAQLHAGANGERGEPATLTDDQSDRLYQALEDGI